jgi:hypothetical protein
MNGWRPFLLTYKSLVKISPDACTSAVFFNREEGTLFSRAFSDTGSTSARPCRISYHSVRVVSSSKGREVFRIRKKTDCCIRQFSHIFEEASPAATSNGHIIMKDVAKKIAMSVGAPVVIVYLLVVESFLATKKILKPARVHPIGV